MGKVSAGLFADLEAAHAALSPAQSHKTDQAGRWDLRKLIADGSPVRLVDQDGQTAAAYVVQPFGRTLWITAAAGRAGFPLCPEIDQFATAQARQGNYAALAFRTERAALVMVTERLGYRVQRQDGASYYMRKSLND